MFEYENDCIISNCLANNSIHAFYMHVSISECHHTCIVSIRIILEPDIIIIMIRSIKGFKKRMEVHGTLG